MEFDELTPPRLAAALGTTEPIEQVAWERIGEERGFSSKVARVRFREGGRPRVVVAKADAKPEEVRAYREFAATAPMPRLLGATDDLLLIEHLDGEPGDGLAGCDADAAARVLNAMAPLHAAWWQRPPEWPRRIGNDPAASQRLHEERLPVFLQRYAERLPPALGARIEALAPRFGETLARLGEPPRTVLHADLHLDNVLFGERVFVLDWEIPAVGRAAYDVAWFYYPSLDATTRREHGDAILRGYHERLGVRDYPFDRFEADLRDALQVLVGATLNGIARLDRATCAPGLRDWIDETLRPGNLLQAAAEVL